MLVTPILASSFRSDGGAMFGLVPKPIWSKLLPPNERNGIPQNTNALLVELDDGRRGLVETGCGDPALFSDKEKSINGLHESWFLMENLARHEVAPEDIDFVILSHLHWDHAGGCGKVGEDGTSSLNFPNAVYFIHRFEWDDAMRGDPLLYKSYSAPVLQPLRDHVNDHVALVTDLAPDILPGIRMARSGGHTHGHCVVVLRDEDLVLRHPDAETLGKIDTLVYTADICPTQHHLRMVFQTAYDTFPMQTREWKLQWLPEIAADRMVIMFGHDPEICAATIAPDEKKEYRVVESLPVLN